MPAMLETELKFVLSFPAFLILELLAHEPLLFCEIWMDFVELSTRWVMMTCGVVVPRVLIKINPLPEVARVSDGSDVKLTAVAVIPLAVAEPLN